ncbi:transposase [Mesorhizobium carmichaelinearum]|uniref:transposase n=1 Tax=Mesorhizobium carmichaelinearum TaxID=1208188 RepID=UPI0034E0D248
MERIIAPVEVGAFGADTRFIVTNLGGTAKALYEGVYCRHGAAENHIKSWKTHLAADRTYCAKATANQFRLFLNAGAYWLMWGLRAAMPKRSSFAVAPFDTLRLRLIKIAARVVEMKTRSACICRRPAPTSASCASSSIASRAARETNDADTPKQTRRAQPPNPPSITTDHRRRLKRVVKKRRNSDQIAASGRLKLSPCIKDG